MKILLVCPYAWDAPGGVQVHVRQLATSLRATGHDVLVLAPSSSKPAEAFVRVAGRPIRVPYNESVAPISPTPGAYRAVRGTLERFRPDIVHVHEPFVPGPSILATLSSQAPVVATFHAYADRSRLLSIATPALRRVGRRVRIGIAVSDAAAAFVAGAFPRERMRVVPNGADVELFASAQPASLPEGRRILFVNRLDPRKGFRVMAEAFAELADERPDAVLVVAGDGAERPAVDRLPPDARARVVMLGNVAHDELPAYHAAAEVFCAPATGRESFGIVLVEAMAAGLPVVASDIPGYREVVRDDVEGLLVPPREPAALADAVRRVLGDADLAKRLGEAGRLRAQRYSWDSVARDVEEIYREALA